jgi:hypothetical protein
VTTDGSPDFTGRHTERRSRMEPVSVAEWSRRGSWLLDYWDHGFESRTGH